MALYRWVCGNCGAPHEVEHLGFRPALTLCPSCSTDMLEPVLGLGRVATKVRGGSSYQACLARHVNDPEAFCDGPRDVQKLVDKRRREGWGDPISGNEVARQERKPVERKSFKQLRQEMEGS